MTYTRVALTSFGKDNWCLKLKPLYSVGLLAALSNGHINILDFESVKVFQTVKAFETCINAMSVINNYFDSQHLFTVASANSVKLFDVRSNKCVATIHDDNHAPILSIDSRHDMLACGTELKGTDAKVHIYDIKKLDLPLRSFIDSHHDDVTDLKFHPSDQNLLLSGSTDGYVNVYDLSQTEEEYALHQVINFSSIHSCGWLSSDRIWTLSHIETFAVHQLNTKSDDQIEPSPLNFGDIRGPWNCDYVVDIYPGFIATGKLQEEQSNIQIIPFKNENCDMQNTAVIPAAHGTEIVRDVLIPEQNTSILYSGGEDGNLCMWKSEKSLLNFPEKMEDCSEPYDIVKKAMDIDFTSSKLLQPQSANGSFEEIKKNIEGNSGSSKHENKKNSSKKLMNKKKTKLKEHRYKPY